MNPQIKLTPYALRLVEAREKAETFSEKALHTAEMLDRARLGAFTSGHHITGGEHFFSHEVRMDLRTNYHFSL